MSRKNSILAAAAKLFAEKGFEATPTSEVARSAGVAEGTIFHHFKTKDGILVHLFHAMMEQYVDEARRETDKAEDGLDAVLRIVRHHFAFIAEHVTESLVLYRDVPTYFLRPGSPHRARFMESISQAKTLFTECIEKGRRDGTVRPDISPERATFLLRGLLIGMTRHRMIALFDIPDLTEDVVEFCRRGLENTN